MPDTRDLRPSRWWPADPSFFTNTAVCPACFSPLGGAVCVTCGLDLTVPAATDLLEAGTAVASAESRRQDLLARMRAQQEERRQAELARREADFLASQQFTAPAAPPQYAFAPTSPEPTPVSGYPTDPGVNPERFAPGAWASPPAYAPPVQPPNVTQPPENARPRRSGIQILMLTVGVLLVAVMALFFVLVAYLVASLEVRSVLTGAASIVVFGVAALLFRRKLHGTAEGIASLAVVLFLLDLWIIRANGLFGSDGLNVWLYTGVALGILSGLLVLAFRILPLRTLSVSAVFLGPVAAFTLVLGLFSEPVPVTGLWAAAAAAAFGTTLLWPRIRLTLERVTLRLISVAAAALGTIFSLGAFPDLPFGGVLAFTVIAGCWLLALVVDSAPTDEPSPTDSGGAAPATLTPWRVMAAAGLGLASTGAGLALVPPDAGDGLRWLPLAGTALAAVLVALLSRAGRLSRSVRALRIAAWVPLGVAGLGALPAAAANLIATAWGVSSGPFALTAFERPDAFFAQGWAAPLAVLSVAGLGFGALYLLGLAHRTAWAPVALGGIGLVGASATLGQPVVSTAALGALSVSVLAFFAWRRSGLRFVLGLLLGLSLLAFGTIGATSTVTFPFASLGVIALLIAFRQAVWFRVHPVVAVWLLPLASAAASVAVVTTAGLIPAWFAAATGGQPHGAQPVLWFTAAALILWVGLLAGVRLLTRAEAAAVFTVAVFSALGGISLLLVSDEPDLLLVVLALAAAGGIVWQLIRTVAGWPERYVAAALAPAAIAWASAVAWSRYAPTSLGAETAASAVVVVLAGVVLVLAAGAHLLFARATAPRVVWDSVLGVISLGVLAGISDVPRLGWLALLLLAVAALVVASGSGGIVTGASQRRHLAWLGLPLSVASLWLGLVRSDVDVVEWYTLPVAGLLLAILWLILARRPVTDQTVPGRSVLLIAAVIVGLAPSAVAGLTSDPFRAVVVLLVSGALVVAGALAPAAHRGLRGGIVLWSAGVGASFLAGAGRAFLHQADRNIPFEWWSAGAAGVLLTAALLWHLARRSPGGAATVSIVAAVVALGAPTMAAVAVIGVEPWRALTVFFVLCGFALAACAWDAFSPALRWVSIATAAALAGLILSTAAVEPFEIVTVPLAFAIVAGATVRLVRRVDRERRVLLFAGLALGLAPSALFPSDSLVRSGVVLAVSAVLIAVGLFTPARARGLDAGRGFWVAGVLAAFVAGVFRALGERENPTVPFEVWSATTAALLLAAGLLWFFGKGSTAALPAVALSASVVALALPTMAAVVEQPLAGWRGVTVLLVLCGMVLAASVRDEFAPVLRWVSLTAAAVLVALLVLADAASPFELATAPLALALVGGGAVRLVGSPEIRSWAPLGAGLLLLLVPSLLADFGANELWRVVALGVVSLVVLGAGLALKLQAPTLIGAVVVVVHALAQLWPWISGLYGSVPWWLWAGIGGVILIVLAATYERRIRDLRSVARGISSLR